MFYSVLVVCNDCCWTHVFWCYMLSADLLYAGIVNPFSCSCMVCAIFLVWSLVLQCRGSGYCQYLLQVLCLLLMIKMFYLCWNNLFDFWCYYQMNSIKPCVYLCGNSVLVMTRLENSQIYNKTWKSTPKSIRRQNILRKSKGYTEKKFFKQICYKWADMTCICCCIDVLFSAVFICWIS